MRPSIPTNHPDYSKTVRKMSPAEWHNIWLFSIYAIVLAFAIGMGYRVINIDRNLEKLVAIQGTNSVSQSVLTINTK